MGGASSSAADAVSRGTEIERFKCTYLGSVPVRAISGNDVAKMAVDRIVALKQRQRQVELIVTTRGLYLLDGKTKDTFKEVAISDVSFVAQDPMDEKTISFFENDKSLRLTTCHTFRVAKQAFRIPVAINEAFKVIQAGGGASEEEAAAAFRRRSGSKKDAIRASTSKSSIMDKGESLMTLTTTFFGSVNVSSTKGDDVIADGWERVMKLDDKPLDVVLNIYEMAFELLDAKTRDPIQLNHILDFTYCKLNADKNAMGYIIHDRRLDRITVSVINLPTQSDDKDTPSVRRVIDGAQKKYVAKMKAEEEQKKLMAIMDGQSPTAGAEAGKEVETGRIIGVFESVYLGSASVTEPKGQEAVESAIRAVSKMKNLNEGVFLQVGTEGVRNIEALSHETLASFVMKDISFTTVAGKLKDVFAFIQKDDALGMINCHLFKCAGERAFDIATAFGEAFKAFAEEQKSMGANPFLGHGPRVAVPPNLSKKQVHRSDLHARKPIGAGQFGQVYLAHQVVAPGQTVDRAVKMLRGGASDTDRGEFMREAETMFDLEHDNLVSIIGVAVQQKPWLMVLEFLQYGDLRNLLKGCEAKGIALTIIEQLTFGMQICAGMAYMAQGGFIHMDLAARNCLVGGNNNVKVADFGLTRRLPPGQDYWQSMVVMKMPVKWCAIECLEERVFSSASDVWAYAVTLWEVFSYGDMPYGKLQTAEVQRHVREGVRLDKPAACPDNVFQMMTTCWNVNRHARPTFAAIASELQTYMRGTSGPSPRDVGAAVLGGKKKK